jgi:hypothetical protein
MTNNRLLTATRYQFPQRGLTSPAFLRLPGVGKPSAERMPQHRVQGVEWQANLYLSGKKFHPLRHRRTTAELCRFGFLGHASVRFGIIDGWL